MWLELCINLTRLVINENILQMTTSEKEACHAVIEIHVFDVIYVFRRRSEGMLCDSTHAMQVNCIILSKRL